MNAKDSDAAVNVHLDSEGGVPAVHKIKLTQEREIAPFCVGASDEER
jgi:hypothetical protein